MKIAFLHMTLGLIDRGSEVTTKLLASSLAKRHSTLVIQAGPIAKNLPYKEKRVYPLTKPPLAAPRHLLEKIIFRLHQDKNSQESLAFTEAALPALSRFHPEIIFATNGAGQIHLLKKHFPNSKIVVIGHAGIGHDDLANLKAHPDLFVALTPAAKTWATTLAIPSTKIIMFGNPLNPALYKNNKPYRHNLPAPVVLAVGALSAYKNIDQVVIAARSLGVSLLLVGDGEQFALVSDLLCTYPTDFRWLKSVPQKEIPQIYASADVFVFVPTSREAFGRVYLEAMAAGLPIVATDDAIRHAIIGERGIYVQPGDQAALQIAINKALTLGKIDYSQELKPYALTSITRKLENTLYELLK